MSVRKSKDQRRLEIIEISLHLAAKVGPDRITVEAIAAELGLTQPAIFRHFPRKDDIWVAALDWLADDLTELWSNATVKASPGRHLTGLVGAHLDFITAHPALPLVLLSPELQARHAVIRQTVLRLMALFHQAVSQALRADEVLAPTDRAAWMVIALVQGLALRWVAAGHAFDLRVEGLAILDVAVTGLGVSSLTRSPRARSSET